MTTRIGTVWDRTIDVVRGRAGILAALATLYIVLPNVVSAAASAFAGLPTAAAIIGLAASLLLIFGVLAITAVASDPAVGTAEATAIAARRSGAALGILAIVMIVVVVAMVPAVVALLASGVQLGSAGQVDLGNVAPGALALPFVVMLVTVALGLWASARLVPLFAVVVNERLGLGALRRSFVLTRGAAPKLIGVIVLYAIVMVVVAAAATSVVGVVARLLLGGDADAGVAFVVALVTALVTAAATVLQTVFYTQFYVAARDGDAPGIHPAA